MILSDTILKAPLWLMISNPTPRYGPGSDMPDIIGGSFGDASYNEQRDYLGLSRDAKLTIVPHGGRGKSKEKAALKPEKPTEPPQKSRRRRSCARRQKKGRVVRSPLKSRKDSGKTGKTSRVERSFAGV